MFLWKYTPVCLASEFFFFLFFVYFYFSEFIQIQMVIVRKRCYGYLREPL